MTHFRTVWRRGYWLPAFALLAVLSCDKKNSTGPDPGPKVRALFVAVDGDDSGAGTEEEPWATIGFAATQLKAGDILTVKAGTYGINKKISVQAKGRADAWIVIRAAAGERVTIEAGGANIPSGNAYPYNQGSIQIENAEYVRVAGFDILNSHRSGINIDQSHHVDVTNCLVRNTLCPGIAAWQGCSNIRVLGNTVINANDMRMSWDPYTGSEAPHEAISMAGPADFEVAWNLVMRCKKEGIDCKETAARGKVHHNYVHHCDRQGLYVDGWFGLLEDIEMHDNVVHDCEAGIAVSSEDGPDTRNIRIHHNLVYNNRATGLFFSRWGQDNPRDGVQVWNNTFYRNGYGTSANGDPNYWLTGGLYLYSTNLRNIEIRNNIFAKNKPFEIGRSGDYAEGDFAEKSIVVEYNLIQDINTVSYPFYMSVWAKDWIYPVTGDSSVQADPLFVDPAAVDFRITEGSPGIDAGHPDAAYNDADGSRCDMGAFPYGTESSAFWWNSGFPPVIDIL
ncbi:right-handed parallel beta-helix repeat-containing protein [bacterium]|nr:right-handed parallel beta-helix repeat-containing protein [bacterium]